MTWRRVLGTVLLTAAALVAARAVATVAWQDPVSALGAARAQAGLQDELDALLDRPVRKRPTARRWRPPPGGAVARLEIPRLGLRRVVVEGTSEADLRRGPGHARATALPGQGDTVAIAGHRTTYGAPFRHLDRLRRGDRIVLRLPYGTATYRVRRLRVVLPSAVWAFARTGRDHLVLSACHPPARATERLLVFADPVGAPA